MLAIVRHTAPAPDVDDDHCGMRTDTGTEVLGEVKVTLRMTISRPVSLGVRRPSGTRDQFFFFLRFSFRQCSLLFLVPSLTRGLVCNLLFLLVLARAAPLGFALSDERSGRYQSISVSMPSVTLSTTN
jgi:hypothetical protein